MKLEPAEQNTVLEPVVLDPGVAEVLTKQDMDPEVPTEPSPDPGVLMEEDTGPDPGMIFKVEQRSARTDTTNPDPKPLDGVSVMSDNFVNSLIPYPSNNKINENASVCTKSDNKMEYNLVPDDGAIETPDLEIFHPDTLTYSIQ